VALRLSSLAVLLWAAVIVLRASPGPATVERMPLAALERRVGAWHAASDAPLDDDVVRALGVDDYVSRHYLTAGERPAVIGLYAGYYASQQRGDTIHSPLACLPGTGWQVEDVADETLPLSAGATSLRRVVVRRGLERSALIYWYQGRGRIIGSDYRAKALLAWDGLVRHRTDGGMVRVMTPIGESEEDALADLRRFTAALMPLLDKHFPG